MDRLTKLIVRPVRTMTGAGHSECSEVADELTGVRVPRIDRRELPDPDLRFPDLWLDAFEDPRLRVDWILHGTKRRLGVVSFATPLWLVQRVGHWKSGPSGGTSSGSGTLKSAILSW